MKKHCPTPPRYVSIITTTRRMEKARKAVQRSHDSDRTSPMTADALAHDLGGAEDSDDAPVLGRHASASVVVNRAILRKLI